MNIDDSASADQSSPAQPTAFDIKSPEIRTVPLVFASPHSGSNYPADFVAGARLDPVALRRSEDGFVDDLFAAAPDHGAPLLRALFPRAFIDANREPFELDQGMFSDRLPDYVNTDSSRVELLLKSRGLYLHVSTMYVFSLQNISEYHKTRTWPVSAKTKPNCFH